jgi:hypothetical protein
MDDGRQEVSKSISFNSRGSFQIGGACGSILVDWWKMPGEHGGMLLIYIYIIYYMFGREKFNWNAWMFDYMSHIHPATLSLHPRRHGTNLTTTLLMMFLVVLCLTADVLTR